MKNTIILPKILKEKCRTKYFILFFIFLTALCSIVAIITQYIKVKYNTIFFIAAGVMLFFSYGLVHLFNKKFENGPMLELVNLNRDMYIMEYLKFFAANIYSDLMYSEIIVWFARDIQYFYRQKYTDSSLISGLYRGLKLKQNGLCLPSYHKTMFIELCEKIVNGKEYDLNMAFEQMVKTPKERSNFISVIKDVNLSIYILIIVVHIIGCGLISESFKEFIGNFLLYVPSDILLICVYKGLVKEPIKKEKPE